MQNCGAATAKGQVTVAFDSLDENDLKNVLLSRGKIVDATQSRSEMEKELDTSGGNLLTEKELMAVSRNSLTNIMNSKNIVHTSKQNKTQLIKRLLG